MMYISDYEPVNPCINSLYCYFRDLSEYIIKTSITGTKESGVLSLIWLLSHC